MDSTRLAELTAWIATHPQAAGGVIFAAAFLDALLVIGAVVPAIPIFFAVGALVGLGSIDGAYAIATAAAGAFCGDGLSYLLGRRYGDRLRGIWPFSRYPHWLERGESLFERHGALGLLIARYVGAVRPFVPAIAGMLGMPAQRYALASAAAGLSWAALFIGPGWLFGASMDVLSAIAGRLSLLLLAIAAILLAAGWSIARIYAVLAPRAAALVGAVLGWSNRHPRWSRWTRGLVDPQVPESTSLVWFALTLGGAGLVGAVWLGRLLASATAPAVDQQAAGVMLALRSPLADPAMDWLAQSADILLVPVLGAATTLLFALRGHRSAALHFAAAVGFGLGFDLMVAGLLGRAAFAGASLASQLGLLAILLARDLPGRTRIAPYLGAGLWLALPMLAALYLGRQSLSTLMLTSAAGLAWAAALGLGFRQHPANLPPMPRWSALWLLALLAGHGLRHDHDEIVAGSFLPQQRSSLLEWRQRDWAALPATREDFTALRPAPLDLQYAGSLEALAELLQAQGWQRLDPPGWPALLATLDGGLAADRAAPLPAAHLGLRESLLLRWARPEAREQRVLRLWPSRIGLEDGRPVWQGEVTTLHFEERLHLFRGWFPHEDDPRRLPLDGVSLPADWSLLQREGAAGPVQLLWTGSVAELR